MLNLSDESLRILLAVYGHSQPDKVEAEVIMDDPAIRDYMTRREFSNAVDHLAAEGLLRCWNLKSGRLLEKTPDGADEAAAQVQALGGNDPCDALRRRARRRRRRAVVAALSHHPLLVSSISAVLGAAVGTFLTCSRMHRPDPPPDPPTTATTQTVPSQ